MAAQKIHNSSKSAPHIPQSWNQGQICSFYSPLISLSSLNRPNALYRYYFLFTTAKKEEKTVSDTVKVIHIVLLALDPMKSQIDRAEDG